MSRKFIDLTSRPKLYLSRQYPHTISFCYVLVIHSKTWVCLLKDEKDTFIVNKMTQLLISFGPYGFYSKHLTRKIIVKLSLPKRICITWFLKKLPNLVEFPLIQNFLKFGYFEIFSVGLKPKNWLAISSVTK